MKTGNPAVGGAPLGDLSPSATHTSPWAQFRVYSWRFLAKATKRLWSWPLTGALQPFKWRVCLQGTNSPANSRISRERGVAARELFAERAFVHILPSRGGNGCPTKRSRSFPSCRPEGFGRAGTLPRDGKGEGGGSSAGQVGAAEEPRAPRDINKSQP